jgi:hypothetical protein
MENIHSVSLGTMVYAGRVDMISAKTIQLRSNGLDCLKPFLGYLVFLAELVRRRAVKPEKILFHF